MGKCTTVNTTDTKIAAIVDAMTGNYVVSKPGLAIGSTPANVANVAFDYTIAGVRYTGSAVAAGTAPGNDVVPQDTYGAVALDIDNADTITVAEAANNATGYATAAAAIADIPAVASTKTRMGTVTVIRTTGDFTFGTTSLADADTTVVYTDSLTGGETVAATD